MKITFSIYASDQEPNFASEEELKNNLEKHQNYLAPGKCSHLAYFQMCNSKNNCLIISDYMQSIMLNLCFSGTKKLLNNQSYTYINSHFPEKIVFEPTNNIVKAHHPEGYYVEFDKLELCVELYKCGQRYIDFTGTLRKLGHENNIPFFQELADKTKNELIAKGLL